MPATTIVQQMQYSAHRIRHRDADVDTGNRNIQSREYKTASLYHNRIDIAEYPPRRVIADPAYMAQSARQRFPANYAPVNSQK